MPHGQCYLWNPGLVGLHLATDLAIGLSCVAISLTLALFVRRANRDVPFSWVFLGFGVFIIASGMTHFMEVWTLWTPLYWLSGAVKLTTAAASITVAIVLPPLVPKSLALLRSAKLSEQRRLDLESTVQSLREEVAERARAESEIRKLNADLEMGVRLRTDELAHANQSLARLAAIVECSNDAIVSVDIDNRITSWNSAAERLYGYVKDEILGRPVSILAPADLSSETPDLIGSLRRGERVNSIETVRVRKTGEAASVEITASLIKNGAGETAGASLIVRDVRDRKRAEGMFRVAVEAAPNAVVIVDEHGKIKLVNAQTEKLFGYSREELTGREVDMLVPPKYRDRHPEYRSGFMREPVARAGGAGQNLYGLRKDGSEFPVEIGLNPIMTDQGTWVLSSIVDITERKRLNEDLERRVAERTAELTRVNVELEAFSYSVSHDLRAPLRQISGFSKILVEEHGPELNAESRRYLQRVQDGAQQMGRLIDDLLNLARLNRQVVSWRPTPLDPLVDAIVEDSRAENPGRDIDWQVTPLGSVAGDRGLLNQVFVNLLSNAVKYTRPRDHAVIQVGWTMQDEERTFFVRDNGVGFDMEYAGKLFGVFQRFHKAAEFEGTGVGLAIVQRIIHKHGGRIWAQAEPDNGATFFFTVPNKAR